MDKINKNIRNNTFCCVPQCTTKGTKCPEASFHRFPTLKNDQSAKRRREWIRILRIGKTVSDRMRVCSKHFKTTDYILPGIPTKRPSLKKIAIPSLSLPLRSTENQAKLNEKARKNEERKHRLDNISRKKAEASTVGTKLKIHCKNELTAAEALLQLAETSVEIADEQLETVLNLRATQVTQDVATQVTSGDFPTSVLINVSKLSSKQINSLTGIPSLELFGKLVEYVSIELEKHPKRRLSVAERITLTMMRIKLNLSFCVISILFGCTSTTTRVIFDETVHSMAAVLQAVIEFPSKETILNNMPVCFKNFLDVRLVLDCTEIYVVKSKCLKCRIMTYSQYYKDHTLKYLIGSTPGGTICFVSKGYGGRASDKCMTEQSGVISFLEPSIDAVMVDKGFAIKDICEQNFIKLIQPPFLKEKKQFSAEEANLTKQIASARVHIERNMQRIKIFKLLQNGRVPWDLVLLMDEIMIIVAGICNLSPSILSDDKYLGSI